MMHAAADRDTCMSPKSEARIVSDDAGHAARRAPRRAKAAMTRTGPIGLAWAVATLIAAALLMLVSMAESRAHEGFGGGLSK